LRRAFCGSREVLATVPKVAVVVAAFESVAVPGKGLVVLYDLRDEGLV
jgi:hypothetical protein